jgi:hypothetical protein
MEEGLLTGWLVCFPIMPMVGERLTATGSSREVTYRGTGKAASICTCFIEPFDTCYCRCHRLSSVQGLAKNRVSKSGDRLT